MSHGVHVRQVRNTIFSLTEPRSTDVDYTARQYAEVEWIVTGEIDKALPSVCMNIAMIFMLTGE